MPPVAREFFTVDLRGLRAALAARAAEEDATESDVLRGALVAALGDAASAAIASMPLHEGSPPTTQVKLSVRMTRLAAYRLDRLARAAGLSRGAYLTRLIAGAPPVITSADRAAASAALNASATELALLSRDINHLTQLLRSSSIAAARQYRERFENLDTDVRAHLDLAAGTLAELSSTRIHAGRPPTVPTHRRSPP